MSLKQQIDKKLNEALKAKDKNTYPTLRLVVSAIKDAEIAGRSKVQKEINDSDITVILKKMIKQRNESCEVYKKAGRKELLEAETREIEVISLFLPKQLSEEETKKICQDTVKAIGATSMKDMGKVMGLTNSQLAGKADGKTISGIVKKMLSN